MKNDLFSGKSTFRVFFYVVFSATTKYKFKKSKFKFTGFSVAKFLGFNLFSSPVKSSKLFIKTAIYSNGIGTNNPFQGISSRSQLSAAICFLVIMIPHFFPQNTGNMVSLNANHYQIKYRSHNTDYRSRTDYNSQVKKNRLTFRFLKISPNRKNTI